MDPVPGEVVEIVRTTLEQFIDAKQSELAAIGPDLDLLFDTAHVYLHGGKRLRPAFAYWGFRAAGGSPDKAGPLIRAASAIELVHASALVHDDVMDDSATRRGHATAHHRFAAVHRADARAGDSESFGVSSAILLGDLLLSWSDELLAASGLKPKALTRARVAFDRLRTEVVAGQYLDVLAQTSRRSSAADAMRVLRYKSAKYTIERPLQFGALAAKADPVLLRALSSYGLPLGEAFQLRDDMLGLFGSAEVTGKPAGDDIREGKRTLLIARAYGKASADQRAVLDENLGNPKLDAVGLDAVLTILRSTGAVDAVETVITELTSAAISAIKSAPIQSAEAREALLSLTERVTKRVV